MEIRTATGQESDKIIQTRCFNKLRINKPDSSQNSRLITM